MNKKPVVIYTDHQINKIIASSFAKGINSKMVHVSQFNDYDQPIAFYGYIRGTGEAAKKSKDFWYMDHGWLKPSTRSFGNNKTIIHDLSGYFRVVHNDYWHNGKGSCPSDRLAKLNIKFKPKRKNGEYIILSTLIKDAKNFYNLHNWVNETIIELKKYSDRKIILHGRDSPIKLIDLLKNAWAFVSDHSATGVLAMIQGIPAYYTNKTLKTINSVKDIEKGTINYDLFPNLAYGQWTLKEMESGEAWDFLKKDLIQ